MGCSFSRAGWVALLGVSIGANLGGCNEDAPASSPGNVASGDAGVDATAAPVTVRMDFTRAAGLYAAPFPSDDLLSASGQIDLTAFPNPSQNDLMGEAVTLLSSDAHGFSTSSGVFFSLTGAIDPTSLPTRATSNAALSGGGGASAFIIGIGDGAPDLGKVYVADVLFETDGGPFGDANLLTILPLQGTPLRASTRYAAVITTKVLDTNENALVPSPMIAALARGTTPAGMNATTAAGYQAALSTLASNGVPTAAIAGLSVFTTDAPTKALGVVRDAMAALPTPVPDKAFTPNEIFDGYCVYSTTIEMPDYQSGVPPFESAGGTWAYDSSGAPILQRMEDANLVVTIPRAVIPAAGAPLVVFIRTGAGGDRPLVDRGVQAASGDAAITPGTGPAMDFAAVGYAGIQVDGPLGGLRNTTNANEDFTIFNVSNAGALRDNVRESAAELTLMPQIVAGLTLDVSNCPGASSASGGTVVGFDTNNLVLMGHSMGASIGPLAMAAQPKFKAILLSGAGGSWLENILYKQLPIDVEPIMEILVGYTGLSRTITRGDPVASMFQWAVEPADEQIYDDAIVREPPAGQAPRHVLMMQGIVDHYIMPPIAETTAVSMGLDLGGDPLDVSTPEIASLPTMLSVLPFVGRGEISLPAQGNIVAADGTTATAIVVQEQGDGIEDGHEVVFQTQPPKHQYRCFLASLLKGVPRVDADGGETDPCN